MSEEKDTGLGAQARALRDDLAPSKIEEKLEAAVEERPKAQHLLDFAIVGKALLAAAVVAALVWLLIGPRLAAIALVVVFVGTWLVMANTSYERRRPTRDADSPESDESDFAGDHGKTEGQKKEDAGRRSDDEDEQRSEQSSRNGSSPDRQRTTG